MQVVHTAPRLYARAKTGQVKWWEIKVLANDDATATIVITYAASEDSKPVVNEEHITAGKNIGKANETTPEQQAVSEAVSRWNKQRDKGYTTEVPPADVAHNTNTLGLPPPMLAHPIEKLKGPLPEKVFVQPKLDGHRCLAARIDEKIVLWTRNGKLIETMGHIAEALSTILLGRIVLDGELYIHGTPLQQIGSLIKRQQEDSQKVEYHVYDAIRPDILNSPFEVRAAWVRPLHNYNGPIKPVPTMLVPSDDIGDYFSTFRAQGYEGAMVRLPSGVYEPGYRSSALLKVKEFQDAEYQVLDIKPGTPKTINGRTLQVAVLDCGAFTVTAPGTAEDKHRIFHNRLDYIGRKITVKYAYLTKDGVPFHPVAVRFRDDI